MGARAVVPNSGRRRVRRSESQWRALVSALAQSGTSRRAFCARHGVSVSTLDWWRKRLGATEARAPGAHAAADALFVELSAPLSTVRESTPAVPGWDVELALGAGVVLRLRRSAPTC